MLRLQRSCSPAIDQTQAAEPVALDVHVEVLAELGLDAAGEAQVGLGVFGLSKEVPAFFFAEFRATSRDFF